MPRSEYARFIGSGAIKPVVVRRPEASGEGAGESAGDGGGAAPSAHPELDKAQGRTPH